MLFLLNILSNAQVCCACSFAPDKITPGLVFAEIGRFKQGTVFPVSYSVSHNSNNNNNNIQKFLPIWWSPPRSLYIQQIKQCIQAIYN